MKVWPKITKNRFIFYSTFWLVIIFILASIIGYTYFISINHIIADKVNDFSIFVMNRDIFSRFPIWNILLSDIQERLIFGYGTESASSTFVAPVYSGIVRDNLASHSLFLELILRLGLVGLLIYLLIFFSIWHLYWAGRKDTIVRVVGSFLLSSMFFSSTGQFWIFNAPLHSAFAWIILGIGIGASLRKDSKLVSI